MTLFTCLALAFALQCIHITLVMMVPCLSGVKDSLVLLPRGVVLCIQIMGASVSAVVLYFIPVLYLVYWVAAEVYLIYANRNRAS